MVQTPLLVAWHPKSALSITSNTRIDAWGILHVRTKRKRKNGTYDIQRDAHQPRIPPAQDLPLVPIIRQLEIGRVSRVLCLETALFLGRPIGIPTSTCAACLRGVRYSTAFVRGTLVSQSAARQVSMTWQSTMLPPSANTTASNFTAQAFFPVRGTMTRLSGWRDGWESTLSNRIVRSDWRSSNAFEEKRRARCGGATKRPTVLSKPSGKRREGRT